MAHYAMLSQWPFSGTLRVACAFADYIFRLAVTSWDFVLIHQALWYVHAIEQHLCKQPNTGMPDGLLLKSRHWFGNITSQEGCWNAIQSVKVFTIFVKDFQNRVGLS